jgi:hypothetical protein
MIETSRLTQARTNISQEFGSGFLFWSAAAERSGDAALDVCFPVTKYIQSAVDAYALAAHSKVVLTC